MFIAIIGTRGSGKSTVENYLVSEKGFKSIRLSEGANNGNAPSPEVVSSTISRRSNRREVSSDNASKHLSFLTLDATPLPSPSSFPIGSSSHFSNDFCLSFSSAEEILDHVTRNWRTDFVTTDLYVRDMIEIFTKRPFFMLLSVDAPISQRFKRSNKSVSLEDFVREDDDIRFGIDKASLAQMSDLVNLHVVNKFESVSVLQSHIDALDLLNPLHLRPDWDTYFMTLASLASQRSNCMKRRVGAILVRDKRIVATGYNGTPRGVQNCSEGGCARCNGYSSFTDELGECVCLHAEENALLEAGRERVGKGSVLYCNTCPCLKCTIKIIQTGVKAVVYNLSYKVDAASAKLFEEAGVELRRFNPASHVVTGFDGSELDSN